MFTGLLKRFLNKTAFMATSTGFMLVITTATVQAAANCSISTNPANATIDVGQSVDFTGAIDGKGKKTCDWTFDGGVPAGATSDCSVSATYFSAGSYTARLDGTASKENPSDCFAEVTVTVGSPQCSDGIDNDGDGETDYPADDGCTDANDNDETDAPPVAPQCSDGLDNDGDGETDYPADDGCTDANDNDETDPLPPIDPGFADQTDFKIMMNYELGMHCTGFEFAYCCVLPVYNSILAQVVKPNTIDPDDSSDYARLMEGDPNEGLDALGRETVVRDMELDSNGNFKKYVLKYWHEAQPRNDGRGKAQTSTLISAVEGNSLMAWNTSFDSAALDANGKFILSGPGNEYNGSQGVVMGDGDFNDPTDNYQNAVWNHLYFYENLEGDNTSGTSLDDNKIRLGVSGQTNPPGIPPDIAFPADCGPAFHPMGPTTQNGDPNASAVANDCGGFSNGNVLTFSGHKGTVVYTQMKVLENLPIMLTSPDVWEALGLPLTPFEDSIDFFSDPGLLNEDSVRPFVAMKAQMYDYDSTAPAGAGAATLDSAGNPVIGFGTAPIDIPNCERCHSNGPDGTVINNAANEGGGTLTVINSPNEAGSLEWTNTQAEYAFWNAYYDIDTGAGDSDWYSRLKSAALSMLTAHDTQHGTSFTANYPGTVCVDPLNCAGGPLTDESDIPQNTRMGHESVICQRCHADNVIAVVKSATCGAGNELGTEPCVSGTLIKPITEAIHNNHRGINMADSDGVGGPIYFADSEGRDGGCQGCHPAHRSDGDMNGYPITLAGGNKYAGGDNRGANGGCFVGRDVHSNPGKDTDGAETPEYLNAVGQWLANNVADDGMGIWCTNCHNQLGQEIWKVENMESLVHGVGANNPRAEPTLADVAAAVGVSEAQAISWLDPKQGAVPGDDNSYAIWAEDPGLCDYVDNELFVNVLIDNNADGVWDEMGLPSNSAHDGNVATIEVHAGTSCSPGYVDGPNLATAFGCGTPATLCGTFDDDGDFSVHILDFCTTLDCVNSAQAALTGSLAVPVPMSAATDGRDHWLSAGEPHCADCHAAPFVEQSGNINAYPPFNYPRKASLMRYSRGHQDISCQGCHESIHGLYPVTPNIDTTTYAQAASLNHDGTHGPIKCGACHQVNGEGVPSHIEDGLTYNGQPIKEDYDAAVAWMHTFTAEADPLQDYCLNCHQDNSADISTSNRTWTEHAYKGRSSREMMDKVELSQLGHVGGDPAFEDPATTVCTSCHGNRTQSLARRGCTEKWKNHLIQGRASEVAWEAISIQETGTTCGW